MKKCLPPPSESIPDFQWQRHERLDIIIACLGATTPFDVDGVFALPPSIPPNTAPHTRVEIPSSPNKFFCVIDNILVECEQVPIGSVRVTRKYRRSAALDTRPPLVALFLLIMYGEWCIWNFVLMAKYHIYVLRPSMYA